MTYSERLDRFDDLLGAAKARSDADRAMVSLLDESAFDSLSRTLVVAALGDATGAAGSSAIRREFTAARAQLEAAKPHNRAGYVDLMCACVWAVGKRDGSAGTDIFIEAAAHTSRNIRQYGLNILAAVGDDRAWDNMLAALARRLAKKITSAQDGSEALMIIGYLARHCGQNAHRRALLAGLLRERWSHVPHAATVAGRYPGVAPDGLPPAEIDFQAFVPPAPWQRPPMTQTQWEHQSSGDAFDFTNGI